MALLEPPHSPQSCSADMALPCTAKDVSPNPTQSAPFQPPQSTRQDESAHHQTDSASLQNESASPRDESAARQAPQQALRTPHPAGDVLQGSAQSPARYLKSDQSPAQLKTSDQPLQQPDESSGPVPTDESSGAVPTRQDEASDQQDAVQRAAATLTQQDCRPYEASSDPRVGYVGWQGSGAQLRCMLRLLQARAAMTACERERLGGFLVASDVSVLRRCVPLSVTSQKCMCESISAQGTSSRASIGWMLTYARHI